MISVEMSIGDISTSYKNDSTLGQCKTLRQEEQDEEVEEGEEVGEEKERDDDDDEP